MSIEVPNNIESQRKEFKVEADTLKEEIIAGIQDKQETVEKKEEVQPDFDITTGFEIKSEKEIELEFKLGDTTWMFDILYEKVENWDIQVHINGFWFGLNNFKINNTFIYKTKEELKKKLLTDMKNLMQPEMKKNTTNNTDKQINKKLQITTSWINYSIDNKEDITPQGEDNIYFLIGDKKIRIENDEIRWFYNDYKLHFDAEEKQLDNSSALGFCNSVWRNLEKKIRDTIPKIERINNLYPQLIKIYTLLEKQ